MLVCAFFDAHCTRDRGCGAHPVFPAPSVLTRDKVYFKTPGASRRESAKFCLPSLRGAERRHVRRSSKSEGGSNPTIRYAAKWIDSWSLSSGGASRRPVGS